MPTLDLRPATPSAMTTPPSSLRRRHRDAAKMRRCNHATTQSCNHAIMQPLTHLHPHCNPDRMARSLLILLVAPLICSQSSPLPAPGGYNPASPLLNPSTYWKGRSGCPPGQAGNLAGTRRCIAYLSKYSTRITTALWVQSQPGGRKTKQPKHPCKALSFAGRRETPAQLLVPGPIHCPNR